MKLDYATLISPFPLVLQNIGSVKPPTLREIFSPLITYQVYNIYLSLLLTDLQTYCEKVNPTKSDWFHNLSDEEKQSDNMFDVISEDSGLQEQYRQIFDFFLSENVIWDDYSHMYYTYLEKDENGMIIPIGAIHKNIWTDFCDVILQMNNVKKKGSVEKKKFKSKLAQEVWELTHPKDDEEKVNKDMELPNIISSVAAKDESLNMINIWDLTVYQLYDQFQRQQGNAYFNISSMSVAAWGDEKNKFDGGAWYHNIYEN